MTGTAAGATGPGGPAGVLPWLARLDELGGFFTLAAPPPPGSDALPWEQVLHPAALAARFTTVRAALAASTRLPVAEVDPKVAVSASQVALASRLWSVVVGTVVTGRWLPDLGSGALLASPAHRGAVPLGVRDPAAGRAVPDLEHAATWAAEMVAGDSLAALNAACSTVGRTPLRVLESNSTSALVGAARVLATQRPQHADQAWALVRLLLTEHAAVRVGGTLVDRRTLPAGVGGAMEHGREAFLRSGCCVFYRLPGHGLCPDCVLAPSRAHEVTEAH